MSRSLRLLVIVAVGALTAGVAAIAGTDPIVPDLLLLGTGLVAGELLELRPADRAPLPLSFAVLVVLARAATLSEYGLVVVAAYLVATGVRIEPRRLGGRLVLLVERLVEAAATMAAYRLVIDADWRTDGRLVTLVALGAASVAPIVVADAFTLIRDHRIAGLRSRGADLALVTSGMLMAIGYGGIVGEGQLGMWGPLLFCIPLLAAWYSFELLASTRRSFRQTVRALGVAPELGGLVRSGHVERVAALAVAIGSELELPGPELEHLETAALLHHLGAVCLDEPADGAAHDPVAVAQAGGAMLRASEALAPAGDIVAAEPLLHRPPSPEPVSPAALSGQILKVASAYDELTEGHSEHAAWAVEALYTGPGYVYDGRVLGALERVLAEWGLDSTES